MAPINLPDGTEVSEVTLPDGASASAVIAPDGTTVFGSVIPDKGIARWTLDSGDVTSSTITDVWYENDGTIETSLTEVSGANQTYTTNEGQHFTNDNYVDISAISGEFPQIAPPLWINMQSTGGYFLDRDNGRWSVAYEDQANDGIEFNIYDGSSFQTITSGVTATNEWNFFIPQFDGSEMRFYVNGSRAGSITTSYGAGSLTDEVYLGGRPAAGTFCDAYIDDPRAYDPLTDSEASNLYNTGSI